MKISTDNIAYYVVTEDKYQLIIYQNVTEMSSSLNGNLDIEVIMNDGKRYSATLFTLENIKELMDGHSQSGENNNGTYLWCLDMVIIKDLSIYTICEVVKSIIDSRDLSSIFYALDDENSN